MEALRSRLARAAAAAAAAAAGEEGRLGRLGDRHDETAGTGARPVSWHPPAFWSRPHD